MALCPSCHSPGAYVGFTVIECRNPECTHFKVMVEEAEACQCCAGDQQSGEGCERQVCPIDPSDPTLQAARPPDPTFGASDPP